MSKPPSHHSPLQPHPHPPPHRPPKPHPHPRSHTYSDSNSQPHPRSHPPPHRPPKPHPHLHTYSDSDSQPHPPPHRPPKPHPYSHTNLDSQPHPHPHPPPPPHAPSKPHPHSYTDSDSQPHLHPHPAPPPQRPPKPHPHSYPDPYPYPYQHPHPPPHRQPKPPKPRRRTTLASCIVATIFLLFIIILLFIIYFSLFKPKDPKITITAMQLPTFTISSNTTSVSFTFSQYAAVKNTNRAVFTHFDSSLQLLYAGNQVGFMFIPAGKIDAGKTEYMAATFSVQSFPIMRTMSSSTSSEEGNIPAVVAPPVTDGVDRVRPTMELESRMEMVGRVRVLWFFSHHVETVVDCRVDVDINGGTVLGFHC